MSCFTTSATRGAQRLTPAKGSRANRDTPRRCRPRCCGSFDHPVIGRCQLHKIRNVADKLPGRLASTVTKRIRTAYHAESALTAEAQLEALAKELERTHPGAAGSLREGMAETLTVLRLGVPPTLARTLRSTNTVESMISIARNHSTNVKIWQNGNMALRWCAAGTDRSGQAVPPRQRPPAPARTTCRPRGARRHANRRHRTSQ